MAWKMADPDKHLAALELVRDNLRYAPYVQDAHGNLGFALWLVLVDRQLAMSAIGLCYSDMVDFNSRDCYEAGYTPRQGALECLENDELGAALLRELRGE
jgi:hypothetical protein